MTNRRQFLKTSGAVALGGLVLPNILQSCASGQSKTFAGIGIQTYTLNSFMDEDPKITFKKLADIGYKNIETATYADETFYGLSAKELKKVIEDLGMKWIGHHVMGVPITAMYSLPENPTPDQIERAEMIKQMAESMKAPNLRDNLQQLVDTVAEGGLKYLICAGTSIETMDNIKKAVDDFSKAGEACKKAGLQFAYHNHATEWDPIEGTTAYDVIMSETDKDLVKLELDLGWVATAKKDAVELFKKQPGRFPLFHLKDFNLETNTIVPVGEGNVDFKPAFDNAELAGMKYFFYEQDTAKSMEEVTLSYNNIKKIIA